jgi:hypothetical protein
MIARLTCAFALALTALVFTPPPARASEAPKAAVSTSHYLAFTGVTATVRTANRRGVLAMDGSLDVPDTGLRKRAEQMNPRLRAAYAQALMIYAGGLPPGRPIDPEYLVHEMQRQTDMVLGKPGAKFLIGSLLVN